MSLTKIGSIGINTGIAFAGVTTIVTLNTANDALSIGATVNVGSGITLGASGDIFATGITTVSGNVKVGTGITLSPDGDVFFTGIATGNGSGLTALNASNIGSGTVPTARLGSGTASSSTFLRGDSTFQTVNTDLVSDTSPQLGGNLDVNTKNILFGDSSNGSSDDVLAFGAGTDLKIYHAGNENFIRGNATASPLYIDCCENVHIRHLDTDGSNSETMIKAVGDGAVELYHNNTKKFETSSSGATVTGGLTVTADVTVTSLSTFSAGLQTDADDAKIMLGASDDLEIWHSSNNNTYIKNSTGELKLASDDIALLNTDQSKSFIQCTSSGAVELYFNNEKTLHTKENGVVVEGGQGDNAILELRADEGDDNADYFRLHNEGGFLSFQDYGGDSSDL